MKHILITLLCMIPFIANGADTMCVKPTTTVVVLDPAINGTVLSYENTHKTWSTQFSYGVISGVGACSGTVNPATGNVSPNQNTLSPYTTTGALYYCNCKMLHPIESVWIAISERNGSCSTICANRCASSAATDAAFRGGMFGNVIR